MQQAGSSSRGTSDHPLPAAYSSPVHNSHPGNAPVYNTSHGILFRADTDLRPPGWLPMPPAHHTAAHNLSAEGFLHHNVSHVMPGPTAAYQHQPGDQTGLAAQLEHLRPFPSDELAAARADHSSAVAPQGQRIPTPPPAPAAQDPPNRESNLARAEAYLANPVTKDKHSESYQRQIRAYAAAADHEGDEIVDLFSEDGYAHHHCRISGCANGPKSHTKNDNTCTGRLTAHQYEIHFGDKHPDNCIYRCYFPNCERDRGFKTEQSLSLHVRTKEGKATRKKVSQPTENLGNHESSHAWAEAFLGDDSRFLKVTPTNKMKTRGYAAAGDHEGVITFLHRFGHGHHHCRVPGCASDESSHTASDWSCTGRLDQKKYEDHMISEHGDRYMYRCYHPRCDQRESKGHGFKREKGLTEHIKKLNKEAGSEEGPATSG